MKSFKKYIYLSQFAIIKIIHKKGSVKIRDSAKDIHI